MKRVSCFHEPTVIEKHTENKCGEEGEGKLSEIYMESKNQNNHYLYEVCFDNLLKRPLYVKYKLETRKLEYYDNDGPKYIYGMYLTVI